MPKNVSQSVTHCSIMYQVLPWTTKPDLSYMIIGKRSQNFDHHVTSKNSNGPLFETIYGKNDANSIVPLEAGVAIGSFTEF